MIPRVFFINCNYNAIPRGERLQKYKTVVNCVVKFYDSALSIIRQNKKSFCGAMMRIFRIKSDNKYCEVTL